jgi:hypothetical protein
MSGAQSKIGNPKSKMSGHRGPDPRDATAFGADALVPLRAAVADQSWLLGHGYAPVSALKLVGDRWNLTERQRHAVRRASCSDEAVARRQDARVTRDDVGGRLLVIDGFNVITTVEAAFGGAVVLRCRDGAWRDIAGVHGTYRKVAETMPALESVAKVLGALAVPRATWLFDRPVSNSGRIRRLVLDTAASYAYEWSVELLDNPDGVLKRSPEIIATSDSEILDAGPRWFNLAQHVIQETCSDAWVVDLGV